MNKAQVNPIEEAIKSLEMLVFGEDTLKKNEPSQSSGSKEVQLQPFSEWNEYLEKVVRISAASETLEPRRSERLPLLTTLKELHLPAVNPIKVEPTEVELKFCALLNKRLSGEEDPLEVDPVPSNAKKIRLDSTPERQRLPPVTSTAREKNAISDLPVNNSKGNERNVGGSSTKLNYKLEGKGFNPPRVQVRQNSQDTGSDNSQQTHALNRHDEKRAEIHRKRFQPQNVELERDYRHQSQAKGVGRPNDREISQVTASAFRTAHQQLRIDDRAKGIKRNLDEGNENKVHVSGLRKPGARAESAPQKGASSQNTEEESENPELDELMENPRMKNIDRKMVETILNEVFSIDTVDWTDIAGLDDVKSIIKEIIIWPMLRPDIFIGLRGPPKGMLLFGPPGTGKTMIGRLIATQSKSSFFNISASSLTSKWIGDGEKMVRALFAVARVKQPAVIFIDEIDSILTQRSDTEHESSRRLKTEFLIQFDGCGTNSEDRILVIGVTNRPQELDEAARRRLVKRIYIPLPDIKGRSALIRNLLKTQQANLSEEEYDQVAEMTEGFSGADMTTLCQEASYGPVRDIGVDIQSIQASQVRPIMVKDFVAALKQVKASVDQLDLKHYEEWDKKFGCRA